MGRVRGAAAVVVALLLALGAVGLLGFSSTLNPVDALLGRGAIVTVPDVVDDARPRAVIEIENQGLVAEVEAAFSLSAPRGTIIAQTPRAGTRVREGTRVQLVVSKGANRVEMPDAVGRPFKEVSAPFETAGIPLVVDRVPSETVEEGIVIAQDPGPGVQVTGEDRVAFTVSAGSADRPVPEVVGRSTDAAAFELGRSGLVVGEITVSDDPTIPEGAIVSSDPVVGEMVARDMAVDLVVSAGPTPVPLPTVTNRTEAAARQTLEDLGFVVAVAGQLVAPDGAGKGAVFGQFPEGGTPHRPGRTVTIVVGREPPPPPPPLVTTTTTTTSPSPTTTTTVPGR